MSLEILFQVRPFGNKGPMGNRIGLTDNSALARNAEFYARQSESDCQVGNFGLGQDGLHQAHVYDPKE